MTLDRPELGPSPTRTRNSVTAAYAVQGFGFAVMLTHVPAYKDRYAIGDDTITVAILMVCVCAGLGSALAGMVAARGGSAQVVRGGLVLAAAAMVAVGLAGSLPGFFLGFGVYGVALGGVDAAMNMQGIDVERSRGRSLLSSFFAANAAGGVLGALTASAAAAVDLDLWLAFVLAAAVMVLAVLVLGPGLVRPAAGTGGAGPEVASEPDPAGPKVPGHPVAARTIVVLGIAMLAFPVADAAVSSWGATFLRDVLGASAVVAPLGYGAYQATLIVSRLCGDLWVERHGRVLVVRCGGALGAAGLLTVALAPGWFVALLGCAATGLGLGVVAPLAFSAAGDRAAEAAHSGVGAGPVEVATATDRAVARLNVFTYAGAVLGGALTGVFAAGQHLRFGFVVLAALAAVSAVLAGSFRAGRDTPVVTADPRRARDGVG